MSYFNARGSQYWNTYGPIEASSLVIGGRYVNKIVSEMEVPFSDKHLVTAKAVADYVGGEATTSHADLEGLENDDHKQYPLIDGRDNEYLTIQGDLYVDGGSTLPGKVNIASTENSTSPSVGGALTVSGGAGIAKDLRVGTDVHVGDDLIVADNAVIDGHMLVKDKIVIGENGLTHTTSDRPFHIRDDNGIMRVDRASNPPGFVLKYYGDESGNYDTEKSSWFFIGDDSHFRIVDNTKEFNSRLSISASDGHVNIPTDISSSSSSSGSLVVSGGVGIGGDVNVDGIVTASDPTLDGHLTTKSYVDTSIADSGVDWSNITSQVKITNTIGASSSNGGALNVTGGIGCQQNIYASGRFVNGGEFYCWLNDDEDGNVSRSNFSIYSNSDGNPAFHLRRGAPPPDYFTSKYAFHINSSDELVLTEEGNYVGNLVRIDTKNGKSYFNTDMLVNSTTSSFGTDTGALVVDGGAGINGDANIGGEVNVGGRVIASALVANYNNSDGPPDGSSFTIGAPGGNPGFIFKRGDGDGGYASRYNFYISSSNAFVIEEDQVIGNHVPRLTIDGPGDKIVNNSDVEVSGTVTASDPTDPSHLATKSYVDANTSNVDWSTDKHITSTSPSSSTSTGALVVDGGVGVGGDLCATDVNAVVNMKTSNLDADQIHVICDSTQTNIETGAEIRIGSTGGNPGFHLAQGDGTGNTGQMYQFFVDTSERLVIRANDINDHPSMTFKPASDEVTIQDNLTVDGTLTVGGKEVNYTREYNPADLYFIAEDGTQLSQVYHPQFIEVTRIGTLRILSMTQQAQFHTLPTLHYYTISTSNSSVVGFLDTEDVPTQRNFSSTIEGEIDTEEFMMTVEMREVEKTMYFKLLEVSGTKLVKNSLPVDSDIIIEPFTISYRVY